MNTCPAKHTTFQPTDEQWRCPKCGVGNDHMYIEEPAPDRAESCERLHARDEVYCHKCEEGWTGARLATLLQKKHDHVECPTCKGRGTVARP